DQATAKAIAVSESNGAPRPAGEPAGSAAPGRPVSTAGPAGPRPAAPGPSAPSRAAVPGGPAQTGPGQPQPGAPAPGQASPAPRQDKPSSPGRAAVIDAEEKSEGVRLMPGGDNLSL